MQRVICLLLALAAGAAAQGLASTGSLHTARAGAAAVRIADGDVLVLGGVTGVKGAALDSAELYDPGPGTFTATGSMSVARTDPQAVLLSSGQVFVLSAGATSTEVYNPAAGAFTAGPALPAALDDPHAVLLPDGRAWITGVTPGCQSPNCTSPIDIYDPKAAAITAVGQLTWARQDEAVVGLGDGRVLVFQGWSVNSQASSPTGSVAICDASGACSMAPAPVGVALASAGAALIGDGEVLICGGDSHAGNATTACEIFDAKTQTLAATTGPMAAARNAPTVTPLQDGTVLVAGGRSGPGPDAEIYNPKLGTFTSAGNFQTARAPFAPGATATLLAKGNVLIAGGISATNSTTALDEAELFTPMAPVADFSLAADQTSVIVNTGATATFKLTAQGANGFSGTIALSCTGNGANTCSFDPASIKPGQSSTLTFGNLDLTGTPVIKFQAVGTSGSLTHALDLRVNLEPRKAVISASGLSFGSQDLGTTSPSQAITLANGGAGTLHISGITSSSRDFIESDNCPQAIGNGEPSCAITVTFAPTAAGNRTGTLSIADDAPFSPQTVALTGTGVAAPAPAVSLSPASLSFGNETVGDTSSAQTLTITNSGTAPLTIQSVAASGDFAAAASGCGTLAAGKSCTVSVRFTPKASGEATGALTLADNASDSPQTVALTGVGQSAAAPPPPAPGGAMLQPASGGSTTATVTPGQSADYSLNLTSTGSSSGAVQLSCSGAPSGATCSTTPSSATLDATPVPVAVTVTTTSASAAALLPLPASTPLWPWLAMTGFAVTLLCVPRRRWVLTASLGAALAIGLAACGGTAGPAPTPSAAAAVTRPGTYQLKVTASANGSPVASAPLTLTVK